MTTHHQPEAPVPAQPTGQQAAAKAALHTRRAFLFKLSLLLNGMVGAVLAVPVLGYILGPALRKTSSYNSWVSLGSADDFPEGQTRLAKFRNPVTTVSDGMTDNVACWVRHIEGKNFQVFAINCAHLGCPVRWFEQSRLFLCPCHGGAYYEDGSRASGPPERGLFQYQYTITGGNLMIEAGAMPTLSTEACAGNPLIEIQPQSAAADANPVDARSNSWPA